MVGVKASSSRIRTGSKGKKTVCLLRILPHHWVQRCASMHCLVYCIDSLSFTGIDALSGSCISILLLTHGNVLQVWLTVVLYYLLCMTARECTAWFGNGDLYCTSSVLKWRSVLHICTVLYYLYYAICEICWYVTKKNTYIFACTKVCTVLNKRSSCFWVLYIRGSIVVAIIECVGLTK